MRWTPNHIGHAAIDAVHGPFQIVNHEGVADIVLAPAVPGVLQLLLPAAVRAVMLAGAGLTHINGEEFEILVAVAVVQRTEGRDLAHKRRSRNAPKFQQDVLFAADL